MGVGELNSDFTITIELKLSPHGWDWKGVTQNNYKTTQVGVDSTAFELAE